MNAKSNSTISERRSQYPLHERLIVYNSESMQRMIDNKTSSPIPLTNPTTSTFMVNGVNILNKNSLDSDTVMHRIMQRRQTHNRVERRRRDRMNNLFSDLSKCLPALQHKSDNNRADILQEAIEYIKHIQNENYQLKQACGSSGSSSSSSPQVPTLYEDDTASVTSSSGSETSEMIFPPTNVMLQHPTTGPSASSSSSYMHHTNTSIPSISNNTAQKKQPMMTPPQSQFEFILSFQ